MRHGEHDAAAGAAGAGAALNVAVAVRVATAAASQANFDNNFIGLRRCHKSLQILGMRCSRRYVIQITLGHVMLLQCRILLLDQCGPSLGCLMAAIGCRRIAGNLFAQLDNVRYVDAVSQRDARNADQYNGQHNAADDQCGHAEAFSAAHFAQFSILDLRIYRLQVIDTIAITGLCVRVCLFTFKIGTLQYCALVLRIPFCTALCTPACLVTPTPTSAVAAALGLGFGLLREREQEVRCLCLCLIRLSPLPLLCPSAALRC